MKKADFEHLFKMKKELNETPLSELDLSDFGVSESESVRIKNEWKFVGLSNWSLLEQLIHTESIADFMKDDWTKK